MHYLKEKSIGVSLDKICILLFQLCVIADTVIGFDPKYYILSKGFMLLFFLTMIIKLLFKGDFYIGWTFFLPVFFMVVTGLSCLWADYPKTAVARYKSQLQFYVLFFFTYLLFNDNEINIKKYLDALYIAGIGMAAFALYRYGLSGLIEGLKAGQRMGRAITNENVFGMTFSKAAFIAYYYYLRSTEKNCRFIHLIFSCIFVLFAFTSGSKKAFLMIIVGALGINMLENGVRKIWKILLTSIIIIILLFLMLRLPIFATMSKRILDFFSGEKDASELVRMKMINLSMQLFHQRPVLGHGFANFGIITGLGGYSHNNMTEVLVSTGIVGFVAFYLPYIPIIRYGWDKGVKDKNYINILLLILALIYLVFGYAMVEYYDKDYWMLFGVLIAFVDSVKHNH